MAKAKFYGFNGTTFEDIANKKQIVWDGGQIEYMEVLTPYMKGKVGYSKKFMERLEACQFSCLPQWFNGNKPLEHTAREVFIRSFRPYLECNLLTKDQANSLYLRIKGFLPMDKVFRGNEELYFHIEDGTAYSIAFLCDSMFKHSETIEPYQSMTTRVDHEDVKIIEVVAFNREKYAEFTQKHIFILTKSTFLK